jgi:hypothetical protein
MSEKVTVSFNVWPIILIWSVAWGTAAVAFQSTDLMMMALLPFLLIAVIVILVFVGILVSVLGLAFTWVFGGKVQVTKNGVTKTYQRGK